MASFAASVAPERLPTETCAVCQQLVPHVEVERNHDTGRLVPNSTLVQLCTIPHAEYAAHPTYFPYNGERLALEPSGACMAG